MDNLLEGIMLCFLCLGVAVMIIRFARQKSAHPNAERAIAVTFGIGFVLGAIERAVIAPVEWTFALYVVGAYLSYTAVLFSFPWHAASQEVNGNE